MEKLVNSITIVTFVTQKYILKNVKVVSQFESVS